MGPTYLAETQGIANEIANDGTFTGLARALPFDEIGPIVGDAIHRSLYHRQVAHVLDVFGGERVLILQFERCRDDTLAQMQRTQSFLGLEPLTELPRRLRRERDARTDQLQLPANQREELTRRLEDDVRRLTELCPEIDLSLWPSFADR